MEILKKQQIIEETLQLEKQLNKLIKDFEAKHDDGALSVVITAIDISHDGFNHEKGGDIQLIPGFIFR